MMTSIKDINKDLLYNLPVYSSLSAFIIYFLPLCFNLISNNYMMPAFFPVNIVNKLGVSMVYFIVLFMIIMADLLSAKVNFTFKNIYVSEKISITIAILYIIIGASSFYYLFTQLGIINGLKSSNADLFYKELASKMQEMSLLKFYFLSQTAILGGWILLNRRPVLLIVFFSLLCGFYILISRREVLFFLLYLIFVNHRISRKWKFIFTFAMLFVSTVTVFLRVQGTSQAGGLIESLFTSQEFYPFQFGAYAIDKTLFSDNFPDISGIALDKNLSGYIQEKFFVFRGYGPTIGVGYLALATGFVPVFLVYFLSFSICKTFHYLRKSFSNLNLIIAFISIKLFIFTRNGELITYIIDILLFLILALPIVFMEVNYGEE